MRDHQNPDFGAAHLLDSFGYVADGVDVETGVDLVEHGDLGLEDGHLEDLRPLLLTAGQVVVDCPLQKAIHPEPLAGGGDLLGGCPGVPATLVTAFAHELGQADAGDLDGILKGLHESHAGPFVDRFVEQWKSVQGGVAGHGVAVAAGEHVAQGGLPGAVRAHDGVHLAEGDFEVDAFEDLGGSHRGLEVLDGEGRCAHDASWRAR